MDALNSANSEKMEVLKDKGLTHFETTPVLAAQLSIMKHDRSRAYFGLYFNIVYEKILDYMQFLADFSEGSERAQAAHTLFEQLKPDLQQSQVSCRKSCAFCCHTPVGISQSEGKRIEEYAGDLKIPWDAKRAHKQSVVYDLSPSGRSLPWEESACVFLSEDSECKVYDVRPIACRKVVVVSDPKLCDPRMPNSPSYLMNLDGEAISAALINLELDSVRKPTTLSKYFS